MLVSSLSSTNAVRITFHGPDGPCTVVIKNLNKNRGSVRLGIEAPASVIIERIPNRDNVLQNTEVSNDRR